MSEEKRMKVFPMTDVKCSECEFQVIIIFLEHADEIGIPLFCPHCGSRKTEELRPR